MPGEQEKTIQRSSRVKTLILDLHKDDENALIANGGEWPEGYLPKTRMSAVSASTPAPSDGGPPDVTVSAKAHPDDQQIDPDLVRAAVKEIYSMNRSMEYLGKIYKGEYQDGKSISGGARWRRVNHGLPYDMGDGSGQFIVNGDDE